MPKEFYLEIDPSVDEVVDEIPGNSFIALRKLRWSPTGQFRLDIRKWFTSGTGEEVAGKGVSFMTDEGPDNLIQAMLKAGCGDTRKTLDGISDRADFLPNVKQIINEKGINLDDVEVPSLESIDESFYDPKSII